MFLWPFSSDSPWNTPIGSGARYASSGAASTVNLTDPSIPAWVNAAEFSHPMVRASTNDPMVAVTWRYAAVSPWTNGTTTYRIPTSAVPAPGVDAHLHVVAPDGVTLHEAFQFRRGTTTTAQKYASFDLRGNGLGTTRGINVGTRAYGGSAVAGLIRRWELEDGEIRHALALALLNGQLKKGYVWPAVSEDTGGAAYAGQVPMGALVAIPASVDIDSLGLSREGSIVARALQDYGAYVVDRSRSVSLYAEPSAESLVDGLRGDMPVLRSLLRVVENNGSTSIGGGGTPRRPAAP